MCVPIEVACYSCVRYGERPQRVLWQGQWQEVEVQSQWREPDGPCFAVTLVGGSKLRLCYHEAQDQWSARPLNEE